MNAFLRITLLPMAALLASAGPPPIIIPLPGDSNHILVIPHESPVQFVGWEGGVATFKGEFVLTGGWSYGCAFDCGDPPEENYFQLELVPEREISVRLPHWTRTGQSEDYGFGDSSIIITREERLVNKIVEPVLRAALRDQKVPSVQGRTSIIVDEFRTGISCDSTYYSARFVAMAEPPKLAKAQPTGVGTCA